MTVHSRLDAPDCRRGARQSIGDRLAGPLRVLRLRAPRARRCEVRPDWLDGDDLQPAGVPRRRAIRGRADRWPSSFPSREQTEPKQTPLSTPAPRPGGPRPRGSDPRGRCAQAPRERRRRPNRGSPRGPRPLGGDRRNGARPAGRTGRRARLMRQCPRSAPSKDDAGRQICFGRVVGALSRAVQTLAGRRSAACPADGRRPAVSAGGPPPGSRRAGRRPAAGDRRAQQAWRRGARAARFAPPDST